MLQKVASALGAFPNSQTIEQADPELWAAIQKENQRQQDHIELIASENYASPAV
ncbi:MAG: hypothetical protein RLZZ20_1246, partial [Pseudomonadota bacterium]